MHGKDLVPVAMMGDGAVYSDETVENLRVEIGEGVTGWVAKYRVPQLVDDTANDPRAITIPGSEPDIDESMLLAPMVHEGVCLGVLVLSKLGLRQFTEDDLRLLVIYASFAAQAMTNADATDEMREQSNRLERQLAAQRELLRTTESILTTLDQRAVLEQITDRMGALIQSDNIAIEVVDRAAGLLVPLTARGVHADDYMQSWEPGETGIATWVVEHNEPVLIVDELTDERVNHFRATGAIEGSLIVVPLLGPDGAVGVLTLERLGDATVRRARSSSSSSCSPRRSRSPSGTPRSSRQAELRARTDDLTGLLNHGTFKDWLARSVSRRRPVRPRSWSTSTTSETVNNRLGHQAGDRLLREIAEALRGAGRDTDAVFRYGGDEFVFLLPHSDATGLLAVAERICSAVAASVATGRPGRRGLASASIGTASFPGDGATAEDVLLAADRACFVAKRGAATGSRPPPRASRWRPSSPSRSRRRSTRRRVGRLTQPASPGTRRAEAPSRAAGRVTIGPRGACPSGSGRRARSPALVAGSARPAIATAACRPGSSGPTPGRPRPRPRADRRRPRRRRPPCRPTPTPGPTFACTRSSRGDTLTRIARRFHTSARSIAYWNREAYPSLDPESRTTGRTGSSWAGPSGSSRGKSRPPPDDGDDRDPGHAHARRPDPRTRRALRPRAPARPAAVSSRHVARRRIGPPDRRHAAGRRPPSRSRTSRPARTRCTSRR